MTASLTRTKSRAKSKSTEFPKPTEGTRISPIGRRIREVRIAAGETLATLSKKTGISPSTLSKIENDKVSPTFSNLMRLASGLRMQLNDLIGQQSEPQSPTARIAVTRHDEVNFTRTPSYEMGPLCVDILNKRMSPLLNWIHTVDDSNAGDSMVRHEGEEFLYVLKGSVEIQTEYYRPIRLDEGDSAYFDSRMAHRFISLGSTPTQILMVWLSPRAQSSDQTMAYVRELFGPVPTQKHEGP